MPYKPDEILAAIVGEEPLEKTDLIRKLFTYIKTNKLQNKRVIIADAKLKLLFGGLDEVDMFQMNKIADSHLKPVDVVLQTTSDGMTKSKLQTLTEQFAAFSAPDPGSWASSELNEGIPQYARCVFLKTAWDNVVKEGDFRWIETLAAAPPSGKPLGGMGPALKRMLDAGVSKEDIVEVVRCMQYETLFSLLYQLNDPGVVEYPEDFLPRLNWSLMLLDEQSNPISEIGGLHESVSSMDPTGREMRPKSGTSI